MNIGFDGKRAIQNNTGLGNYSRFIIEVLSKYYKDNTYVIYAPKAQENKRMTHLLQQENVKMVFPTSWAWKKLRSLWRVWGIKKDINREPPVLFHGLSNELPLSIRQCHTKSIVTMHDLIFLRYPEFYSWIDRHIYTYKYRKACEHADRVVAISEMTKRDLIDFWGIDERKIRVVYQSCHPVFAQPASQEMKERIRTQYHLPQRFILYVGSIESRKNALLIVKALKEVPEEVGFVAIGKRTDYTRQIEAYIRQEGLEHRVQLLHQISFQELPVFYQLASVFVYPSFFEGFGIPIIEAIHSGVPVIAATGSCLEEAGGPDSLYIHPNDESELASCINRVLQSPELAQEMVDKSREYVKRFDEKVIADEMMKVYKELCADK